MEKINAELEKIFAAEDKREELSKQIKEKEKELQELYKAAGREPNFTEYKRYDEKRSAIFAELNTIADEYNSKFIDKDEVKQVWKKYAKAYNADFEKKYTAYMDAKKALAAQLLSLIEMQGSAINRHARCQKILEGNENSIYCYEFAWHDLDLDAPACLSETMEKEVKALADAGFLPREKRLGLVKILKKQTTSAADMNVLYEELSPILQAGMYSALIM